MEIREADAVLRARASRELDQDRARIRGQAGVEAHAALAQRADRLGEVEFFQLDAVETRVADVRGHHDGLARAPAVQLEIVADAREHVVPVAPEIAVTVAAAVDGVAAEAGRHELGHAHRARVRAERRQRVERFLARHQQELLELATEVAAARGVVEGKGGERVDHAVRAGDLAIERLDAGDRQQHRTRHTARARGCLERRRLLAPDLAAAPDAPLRHEARPVLVPGHGLLGRPRHRLDDRGASLHLREQSAERLPVEAVAVGHLGDEAGDFRALAIERLRR